MTDYKTKMLLDEIPVFFSPSLAGFVGVNEAIILQKLYYLMQLDNFGKIHCGYKYIRMTTEEWIKELPFLDGGQVKTAIKNLVEDELLISTTFTGRSKWYSIHQNIETLSGPVKRLVDRNQKRRAAAKRSVEKREAETTENVSEQSVPIECIGTKCSNTSEQSVPIIGTKCSTSNQSSYQPSNHSPHSLKESGATPPPVILSPVKVSAKKPKPEPKPKPEAVKVYKSVLCRWPNKGLDNLIGDTVGNEPEALILWENVVRAWIATGWNPGNVKGMLDFFSKGEIPGTYKKEKTNDTQNKPNYDSRGNQTGKRKSTYPAGNGNKAQPMPATDSAGYSNLSLG